MAALLVSSGALADEACVIGADEAASRIPEGKVLAVAPQLDVVRVECGNGRVEGLAFRLAAGASLEQRLFIDLPPGAIDSIAMEGNPDWLTIRQPADENSAGTGFTLVIRAPAESEEGWRGTSALALDVADESVAFHIPIKFQVTAPEPLFRDDFGPDPIIGQFSFASH